MTGLRLLAGLLILSAIAVALGGRFGADTLVAPLQAPSFAHPFGTDDLGRDVLRAVGAGASTSLRVGIGATAIALGLGVLVGLAAGIGGAVLDEALMRASDVVASLPTLLVAILVAALFGGSVTALVIVLGATRWPLVARLVRVETASLVAGDVVRAATALGASRVRIATRHVLPAVAGVAATASGFLFAGALVSEAALAFVGLGDPAVTSLGQLAANGFAFAPHAPWMWAAPVGAIVVMTVVVAATTDPTRW